MTPFIRHNRRHLALSAAGAFAVLVMSVPIAATAADHVSYVLFAPGSESISMSGSTDDVERARALRAGSEAMLYVRRGGAAFVIRDPATLRAARALFEPEDALGAQQSQLGARQSALGARQAALGAEQARLGARQANASATESEDLSRQQDELGRRQDALGQQQDALGRQQDALGREQDRVARIAEEKLFALVDDAVRRGLAQRVD
jgi:hypothetical protein